MARPLRLMPITALAAALALSALAPGRAATVGDRVAARSAEAEEAYREGDFESSLRLYRDAQLEDPDSPSLHYNVGDAHYKLGQYEAAAEAFAKALAARAVDGDADVGSLYNLGNTLFQQQQFAAAAEAYKSALLQAPGDADAKANLEMALQRLQQQQQQSPESGEQGESDDESESDNESQSTPSEEEEREEGEDTGGETAAERPENREDQPQDGRPDEAAEPPPQMDTPSQGMDEEEAEQLLEALRDREVEAQRRRFRVVPRGHTRDW